MISGLPPGMYNLPPMATNSFLFASTSFEARCQCPNVTPVALNGAGCAAAVPAINVEANSKATNPLFFTGPSLDLCLAMRKRRPPAPKIPCGFGADKAGRVGGRGRYPQRFKRQSGALSCGNSVRAGDFGQLFQRASEVAPLAEAKAHLGATLEFVVGVDPFGDGIDFHLRTATQHGLQERGLVLGLTEPLDQA